jgi:nucleoside-diphosphate-sugar epimerase
MKAAVLGVPFHIRFGGATDFLYVRDTADAFIECADRAPEGAHLFNLHGDSVEIEEIVRIINEQLPAEFRGLVTFSGPPIPIAPAMDDQAIRRTIGQFLSTPLETGIRETINRFIELRDSRRLDTSELDLSQTQSRSV